MARLMRRMSLSVILIALMAGRVDATQFVQGTAGPGAKYAFAVPDNWNGDLVVYGHGIVDPAAPVGLPSSQDGFTVLQGMLLERGFAVASSSYSENGYALKDASQRLHQLSGLFSEQFGQPVRTYLMGHSLGASAVQMLAERFPQQYNGALAMCGILGGGVPAVQYLGNVRVLFDAYFPGVLPGDVLNVPAGIIFMPGQPEFNAVFAALQQGFVAPGSPTIQFALAAKLPFDTASPQVMAFEIVVGALNALGFNLRFTNDLLQRSHEHSFFDNLATVYPPAVDAIVGRFASTPDAITYLERYYAPSGAITFPVLTLHTTRDPQVPVFHEDIYRGLAPAEWLVQRTVNSFGHCAFNQQEVITAFDDLVLWVTHGQRPAGGDATDR